MIRNVKIAIDFPDVLCYNVVMGEAVFKRLSPDYSQEDVD